MSILVCHQAPHCARVRGSELDRGPRDGEMLLVAHDTREGSEVALAIRRQREAQKKKNEAESLHDGCPSRKNAR
jgi:hypothetical protein